MAILQDELVKALYELIGADKLARLDAMKSELSVNDFKGLLQDLFFEALAEKLTEKDDDRRRDDGKGGGGGPRR